MANIKIPVTPNNKQALVDLMGEFESDEKGRCTVEYEAVKDGEKLVVTVNDQIGGECNITVKPAIDPDTGVEFVMLKEYNYAFKLIDGVEFDVVSTYLYSISNIISRMFYKILSKAKSKYAPVRSTVGAEMKAKLKEERAKFNASKSGKKAPKAEKAKKADKTEESSEDF